MVDKIPTTSALLLKPASRFPVPPHDKLIVSNKALGVSIIGKFQPGFHTHWCELPKYMSEEE